MLENSAIASQGRNIHVVLDHQVAEKRTKEDENNNNEEEESKGKGKGKRSRSKIVVQIRK